MFALLLPCSCTILRRWDIFSSLLVPNIPSYSLIVVSIMHLVMITVGYNQHVPVPSSSYHVMEYMYSVHHVMPIHIISFAGAHSIYCCRYSTEYIPCKNMLFHYNKPSYVYGIKKSMSFSPLSPVWLSLDWKNYLL